MRRFASIVIILAALVAGACGGGAAATTTTAASSTSTAAGSTTMATGSGGTTVAGRDFCEVNDDLDVIDSELFDFTATPARAEELISAARPLVDELLQVAPTEISDEVMTSLTAYRALLDLITGLDYDLSTVDQSTMNTIYGAEEIQSAGAVVDAWISDNC